MSRSYKKFPISRMVLWGRSMKKGKQYANRKIRRKLKNPNIEVGNGRHYRSLGIDSWDLWEFKFLETKQDAIDRWEQDQKDLINGVRRLENITRLEFRRRSK
jgi:hypothetical protein